VVVRQVVNAIGGSLARHYSAEGLNDNELRIARCCFDVMSCVRAPINDYISRLRFSLPNVSHILQIVIAPPVSIRTAFWVEVFPSGCGK